MLCACSNLHFLLWLWRTPVILDGEDRNHRRYTCFSDTGEMTDTERVKADWVVLWRRCIGQRVFGLALSAFFLQVVYRKVQGKTIRYNMKRQVTLDATELMILQGSLFDIFQRGNTLYCIVGAFDCVTSHYTSVYCTVLQNYYTVLHLACRSTLHCTRPVCYTLRYNTIQKYTTLFCLTL